MRILAVVRAATMLVPLIVTGEARAAWFPTGTPVCTRTVIPDNRSEVTDGAGGIIVIWGDTRGGASIYAQRIDPNGQPIWAPGGVPVCTFTATKTQPRAVSDGNGGAVIAWADRRHFATGGYDIYAQRVRFDGATLWAAGGVALDTNGVAGTQIAAISDGSGGAIVAWNDARYGDWNIFARRVDSAGVPLWFDNGTTVCDAPGDQSYPSMVSDGANGAIIAWWDRRNGVSRDLELIGVQHVVASGLLQWTSGGYVILDSTAYGARDRPPAILSDGASGAFLAWCALDRTLSMFNLYAQRLNSAGSRLWTLGGVIACRQGGGLLEVPSIVSDGSGGVIIGFQGQGAGSVSAQRLDATGSPRWGAPGVTVSDFPSDPVVTTDGGGGALLAWPDYRTGAFSDVKAGWVNANGVSQWAAGGVGVIVSPGNEGRPRIHTDASGGAIVTWFDERAAAPGVYARRISNAGLAPVTVGGGAGGQIDLLAPNPVAEYTVNIGAYDDAVYRLRPNPGYYIDQVTVNGATVGVAPNLDVGHVTAARDVQVNFANGTWFEPSLPTPTGSYTTVAFPVALTSADVRAVLGNLGPYDDKVWRLARWDPTATVPAYQFAGQGLSTLQAGAGYWLITKGGQQVQAQGKPFTTDTVGVELRGNAASGWNQIANPYRFPIADTALSVLSQGATLRFKDGANSVTDRVVWEWKGGSAYDSVHTLEPRRAYWLRKSGAADARLVFPNWSSEIVEPIAESIPRDAVWMVSLRARQNGRSSMRVHVGRWRAGASEPLRLEGPPSPPEGGLSLRLVAPGGGSRAGLVEFRDSDGPLEWDLELLGADAPGEIALELETEGLPAGLRLWLSDEARGWSHEVRAGGSVSLAAIHGTRRVRFRAAFEPGDAAEVANHPSIGAAYPNPFRDVIGVTLDIARPDVARAAVFDLEGRRVRDLGALSLTPGEHVLLWDGNDDAGRRLPSGLYLARVEIGLTRAAVRMLKVR